MTPNAARELILARFVTSWADETDYVFENEARAPDADSAYVNVLVREIGGGQDTLGVAPNRKFRRRGTITGEIRVPADGGAAAADALAHKFRGIFEATTFSEVNGLNGLYQSFGANGKWYLVTVDVNFEYDETK